MAVSRFAQVSDEEISGMSFSLFFNSEIILKQLFASGSVNIYHLFTESEVITGKSQTEALIHTYIHTLYLYTVETSVTR